MSDAHGTGVVPTAELATAEPATGEQDEAMELRGEGVPLALLLDLLPAEGPASAEILATEGMPDDAWWEARSDAEDDDAP